MQVREQDRLIAASLEDHRDVLAAIPADRYFAAALPRYDAMDAVAWYHGPVPVVFPMVFPVYGWAYANRFA